MECYPVTMLAFLLKSFFSVTSVCSVADIF